MAMKMALAERECELSGGALLGWINVYFFRAGIKYNIIS
jgi:hypothetical protein